jgi:hypothetical protein
MPTRRSPRIPRPYGRMALLAALAWLAPGGLAAQEPTVRATAELFIRQPNGRVVSYTALMTARGSEAPQLTPAQVEANAFDIVVEPGSTRDDLWFQFHCSANDEPYLPRTSNVNSIEVRRMGALGHDHGGDVPQGSWTPTTGRTNDEKKFYSTYRAPQVAVQEQVSVEWTVDDPETLCSGFTFAAAFSLSARQKGLVPLAIDPRHARAEPVGYGHASVLYVDPSFGNQVGTMASFYWRATRRRLRVHTASLPQGGLFDIGGNYAAPWSDHRLGTEIDVSGGNTPNAVEKVIEAGRQAGLACAPKGQVVHCARP